MTGRQGRAPDAPRERESPVPQLPWPGRFRSNGAAASPAQSRDRLVALARETWTVTRLLAASTLDVAEFEAKLALAEAVHALVETAASCEERAGELGAAVKPGRRLGTDEPGGPDEREARLAAALAAPPRQRLAALPREWLIPLLRMFADPPFDPLLDGPSERVRRRGLGDLKDAFGWLIDAGEQLAPDAGPTHPADGGPNPAETGTRPSVGGPDPAETGTRSSAGGPNPAETGTRPSAGGPDPAENGTESAATDTGPHASPAVARRAQRPTMGRRDARFATFENTRDYRGASGWRDAGSPYDNDLLELVRVNRDEIDALETFALALFDLVGEADLESLRHLARLTWDEARHAAIGQELLRERFGDPYDHECSMIGIRIRGRMNGWDAWTQITVFGELGIIGPMRALAREARRRGDDRIAHAFDFIASDETMHLRDSRRLLERNHPAGGLARAADTAREEAGRILDELGLYDAEHFAQLDERQIFELLGE